MRRFLLLVLLLPLGLAGCDRRSSMTEATSNPDRSVDLLFTKDGVKVYRFYSGGDPVYFTIPVRSVSWRVQSGKTTRPVQTIEAQ